MEETRKHYAEVHWSNADQNGQRDTGGRERSRRSDKQIEEWHDQEHNEDAWFFQPDHEHATSTVKESKRRGKK